MSYNLLQSGLQLSALDLRKEVRHFHQEVTLCRDLRARPLAAFFLTFLAASVNSSLHALPLQIACFIAKLQNKS